MGKIIAFLLVSCFCGVASADYAAGVKAYAEKRWPQAYAEFLPLAHAGDFRSQYYIGRMHLDGTGTVQDTDKAIEFFSKAAAQNYAVAQATLGFMYAEGIGVKENKKKAVELYTLSADQGNGDALLNLGVLYYTGNGVSKNVEKAIGYFSKISPAEKPAVAKYLGDIYLNEEKFKDPKKAYTYYVLAAKSGDIDSYHVLGTMYQDGIHVEKNITEAMKYYMYAAAKGYAPSQYALGVIYANGDGVPRDNSKAHAYFSLAAAKEMEQAVNAKELLEENMSLSERDKANRAMLTVQQEDLGTIQSPIKDKTTTTNEQPAEKKRVTIRRRRRR